LILAKAEQPHFLRLQPVDYGDLAADILVRVKALAPRQWMLDAPRPGVVAGVADADRLLQAMLNLALNAAQHTVDGDDIGVGVALDSPGWIRLWVRDRGTGVDPEVEAGLFGRYARGGNGQAANHHDGVGLGLAIVDAIATAHGGRAEHTPTPGGGATFTIYIPLEPPNDEVDQ
jgi:signal transduction histidine kinase